MAFHITLSSAQLDLNHPDKWEPFIGNFYLKQLYHHRKKVYWDQDLQPLKQQLLMIPNIPLVPYQNEAVNIGALCRAVVARL